MEEVSGLEAGVHVLVCCSTGCGSLAGSDLHLAVVTATELCWKLEFSPYVRPKLPLASLS